MLSFSDPFFCFQFISSIILALKEAFFFSVLVISISYLILPITQLLNKIFSLFLPRKISWNLSTILSFLSVISGSVLLLTWAFSILSTQAAELLKIITDPSFIENFINQVNSFVSYMISSINSLRGSAFNNVFNYLDPANLQIPNPKEISIWLASFLKEIVNSFNKTGQSVFWFYIMFSLYFSASFHIVREWNEWPHRFNQIAGYLTTGNSRRFHFFVNYFSSGIKNWIIGQGLVSSIMSVFYGIGFSIIGILFPLPIGFLFGFAPFIPYLGDFISIISLVISIIYSKIYLLKILLIVGLYVLGHVLGGHILGPILIGNQVGINPIQGIIGFIVYSQIFGFKGIFLGTPISVFINSLLASYFYKEKRDFQKMQIMPDDY